ncbi:MAG TPA: trigger factor [Gammaproteobacteria bacterium]|nr:trigger factor [Gammaproteobacteria bacterium]
MAAEGYKVSVETAAGLERRLTIQVPNAEIEREISLRLAKVGKTAKLKGFRPGKIPDKVVRRYYGGQVREEVLSDVIRTSYSRAIADQKLNPAGGPRIEAVPGETPDQEHFTYRATFEVFPDIALKPLEQLAVAVPRVTIDDSDVDAMIEKLRAQRATWRTVERKAAAGDRVLVDFDGTIDGTPFQGGSGKDVGITVGGRQVLPEFDAALGGAAAGDARTAHVTFPENYGAKELAGKKAEFAIKVQRVEEQVLPELDDAFAASFGVSSGKAADLRAEVRKNMERELAERIKAETKTRAFDALIKANAIGVPRALVEQEVQGLQQGAMRDLGVADPSRVPSRELFWPLAERRVAVGLLIQELVKAHKIRLDAARVERRIQELAAPYEKPAEAAQFYRGDRAVMAQVEAGVLEDQVVDFLLEQAKKSDAASTFKEFMGA